jgi:hypothetical protein
MAKTKASLKQTQQLLSGHKFDTSKYIVIDASVRRDAATGQLVSHKALDKQKK